VAWARGLLALPRAAMRETRRLPRRPLAAAFDDFGSERLEVIVDHWFSPEAQATLRALAARLKKTE